MLKILRLVRNAVSPSRERRYYAAKLFGELLTSDYRVGWHQLDWWENPEFSAFLERFGELDGFNTQRRWMLWQLLRLTGHVPGDTAECGVFRGADSWLIASFGLQSQSQPKEHFLFDSFEGLSEPGPRDGTHWQSGALAIGEEVVRRNLEPLNARLNFYKGWIPERFDEVNDRRFSFVHVDVDLYEPTRDSIEFFYPRLNDGAIFLCDDYACSTCPGATQAIDQFLADKPEAMLSLDAGGGFFIKGLPVQAPPSIFPNEGRK